MNAQSLALIPPAPLVHARDLPLWKLLWKIPQSTLSIWPERAFDELYLHNKALGLETLLINDPEGARHVMTTKATNYRRPFGVTRVAKPLGGSGLFLAEGADWKRQRRLLAPTFTPGGVSQLLPHFHEAGIHLLRSLDKQFAVNLARAFQDTALEAVLRALFSMPESSERAKLDALARAYVAGPGRPSLFDAFATREDSFAFTLRKRERFQAVWFGEIDAIVATRRARPRTAGQCDLLDLLMKLKDADTGEGLSDVEIRDQCATMFFAGSETTARLMFWASYLLALNPEEQSRVRSEIEAYPPDRVGTLDDLSNWPRLRNVLLETLRLYPSLPHLLRDAIGPDKIGDYEIAAKAQVWISPWVMHRHRKFWSQPTAFLPDRFAGKSAPWIQTPAYVPFGLGPRICIGLAFALSEAQIVLARLLECYRIGLTDVRPVMPVGRVTTEPSHEPMFGLETI